MASDMAAIVGRNIRAARLENGIKRQGDLARLLNEADPEVEPTNTRVSLWERGAEEPGNHYMRLLVSVLGKEREWFYMDHEKPEETPDLFPTGVESDPPWVARLERRLDEIYELLKPPAEEAEPTAADVAEAAAGPLEATVGSPRSPAQSQPKNQQATSQRRSA